jgi:hypothetical protein
LRPQIKGFFDGMPSPEPACIAWVFIKKLT